MGVYDRFKFNIDIKKKEIKGLWSNRSEYEIGIEVRKLAGSYSSGVSHDDFKISDKKYHEQIGKIYEMVDNEYKRRDAELKNKKMCDYISLIKTTVKAEMKRDDVIQDILN